MSNELKPCPFCGDTPVFVNKNLGCEIYCEECDQAHAVGYDQKETYDNWNTRTKAPAVSELVEALENTVRYLRGVMPEAHYLMKRIEQALANYKKEKNNE